MSENLDYTMKFEHKVDAKMTEEEVIDYVYDALDDNWSVISYPEIRATSPVIKMHAASSNNTKEMNCWNT